MNVGAADDGSTWPVNHGPYDCLAWRQRWRLATSVIGAPRPLLLPARMNDGSYRCTACQRRTGTAFHFGASFPKEQVRLDGNGRSTSATPTAAIGFDFISARIAAHALLGGRPQSCGLRSGRG